MANSNDAHTPEPWHLDAFGELCGRDGELLCDASHVDEPNDMTPEISPANARRIVACVNACAGIPTEALEDPHTIIEGKVIVTLQETSAQKLLDITQAAARYGVSPGTIRAWRRRGWIEGVRRPGDNRILFAPEATDAALRERGFVLPKVP